MTDEERIRWSLVQQHSEFFASSFVFPPLTARHSTTRHMKEELP